MSIEPRPAEVSDAALPRGSARRLRDAPTLVSGRRPRPHDASEWAAFARRLADRRDQLGLSRREAARTAGVSERAWKLLENGQGAGPGSVRILPNPTDDELEGIARALDLSIEALVGVTDAANAKELAAGLTARIARLTPGDRQLVEALVDRLLAVRARLDR